MGEASNIALTGLQAASLQVNVAANNIVNMFSGRPVPASEEEYDGYVAQEVSLASQPGAGVVAGTRPVTPAFVTVPDADGVPQARPNVDLVSQILTMQTAEVAYRASASLIRVDDENERTLLDTV